MLAEIGNAMNVKHLHFLDDAEVLCKLGPGTILARTWLHSLYVVMVSFRMHMVVTARLYFEAICITGLT